MKKAAQIQIRQMISSLQQQVAAQHAALGILSGSDYCDFFVENGGDGKPFHEKCPNSDLLSIDFQKTTFSAQRMSVIQKIAEPDGGYCDFFVENGGDGKPFHEKCQTLNRAELLSNPAARGLALGRLQVIQAYQKAAAAAAFAQAGGV